MDPNKGARQLCNTLEYIVQCPICHQRLAGDVLFCGSGHSVCRGCTYGVTLCTRCHEPCTTIPNLLAQTFLSQLDGIKRCLMELDASRIEFNHDYSGGKSAFGSKQELPPGQYRCYITEDCTIINYASAIIKHCKNIHTHEFTESSIGTLPYKQCWHMNFSENKLHRAFNIPDVGLFILLLWKNGNVALKGCVIMYAGIPMALKHSYRMEIECDKQKVSYNGQIYSARTSSKRIFHIGHPGLYIDRNESLYHTLNETVRFKCSVVVERDNNDIIEKHQQKKQRIRRRHRNNSRERNKQQLNDGLNKKIGLQNSLGTNDASDKQLIELENLVQPNGEQSGTKEQSNKLHDKLKDLIEPPKVTVAHSHPNNQLTQSARQSFGNFVTMSSTHEMIYERNTNAHQMLQTSNHNSNGAHAPGSSTKYEIPLPINPYFQQEIPPINTTIVNVKKVKRDKCDVL